jgi:tetraacyldisaccharide 4'-kinase
MLSEVQFRELVSGRWQGPVPTALRGLLAMLELPYGAALRHRNRRFANGRHPQRVAAPVISVGNLTVGGTGKTPLVAWLAQWFARRGAATTIISRGYGARGGRPNDEALELAARLPDVAHLQNPDRVAAAKEALCRNPRQVLILDDAFQHRRLARDLDIVLLDALEPFGYERLLPRGLLREPVESLARAQVAALSRSDAVDAARRAEIESRAKRLAPAALWLELLHRPSGLVSTSGRRQEASSLCGAPIAAFCGIGNPAGFRHTLAAAGLNLAGLLELPDHCAYGRRTIERLEQWLSGLPQAAAAICTQKDLVKIPRELLAGRPLFALEIELAIVRGEAEFEALLERVAADLISARGD